MEIQLLICVVQSIFKGSAGCLHHFLSINSTYLIPWVYPPPSNSHHQEYYIFSRESL